MSREYEIKQYTRAEKEALVADADPTLPASESSSAAGDESTG